MKELNQLEKWAVPGKPVVIPINPDKIGEEDKKKALRAVNLIARKTDGSLKGRSCADGSKQRSFLKWFETVASPTVSQEGLLASLITGVYEDRKFISFDVPGAFLQAEMSEDKLTLMKFEGETMVDLMCQTNDEYKQYVRFEGKKKVLYIQVIRAIYGCIESALQWYKLFTGTLISQGFKLNPYDKCVANKIINGKQLTIVWHVDDCLVSHHSQKDLDQFAQTMIKEFGDMKINRGNGHEFLGMKIKVNPNDRTFEIDMRRQINEAITYFESFGEIVDGNATTPATYYLFKVDEGVKELDQKKSEIFHSVTAKLLYIMKRARPDIETSVSFLMKRVSKSDEEDWKKLKRVLGFLKGTIDDVRVIGASSLTEIMTWIDAAHAVHENMRSHMGGLISFGVGLVHAKSASEKTNTKSTCESEVVAVSEYLPYNLWMLMFMREQGYDIKNNVVYQDNKSAILMEVNGRNSCT